MPPPRRTRTGILLALGVLLALPGCAMDVKLDPDVYKLKPKLVLKPGAFRVVRSVSGRASCPFFLYIDPPPALKGVLGLSPSAPAINFALGSSSLRVRAMEDLHRKHDLVGKPQILHNFVEEWTLANYLGIFAIQRLTITAEVIEFTEGTP